MGGGDMVRVATCAFDGTHDVEVSLRRHLAYIDAAADNGAQLVVFSQISPQGSPPPAELRGMARGRPELYRQAEPVPDGPSVHAITRKAVERGIYAIFGFTGLADAGGVASTPAALGGP